MRAYLDLDPGFNQAWHETGEDVGFEGHTHFVTVGQAIGSPACPVPTCGRSWIPTLPPVVLEHWPRRRCAAARRLHDGRQLAELRVARARRRPLRPARAFAARPDLAAPPEPGAVRARARRSIPDEVDDLEALDGERLGAARPDRGRRHAASLREFHQRVQGRARNREERLRRRRAAAGSATAAPATSPPDGRSSPRKPGSATSCRPVRASSAFSTAAEAAAAVDEVERDWRPALACGASARRGPPRLRPGPRRLLESWARRDERPAPSRPRAGRSAGAR